MALGLAARRKQRAAVVAAFLVGAGRCDRVCGSWLFELFSAPFEQDIMILPYAVMCLGVCLSQLPYAEGTKQSGRGPSSAPAAPTLNPVAKAYEVLQTDASWCGPRVLYFMNEYLGNDCKLDDVVQLCNTDPRGYTTLLDLVRAAEALGLEPEAVACTSDQLLRTHGPAIACIRVGSAVPGSSGSPGEENATMHFIGFIGRTPDGAYWCIDPAQATTPFPVQEDLFSRSFSGQAVLLRGCRLPAIRPSWMHSRWALPMTALGVLLSV